MATVLRAETTSSDGFVTLVTDVEGYLVVRGGGQMTADMPDRVMLRLPETSLLEAVLEYAHERGLRRQRKAKAAAPRKRKPAANGTQSAAGIEV